MMMGGWEVEPGDGLAGRHYRGGRTGERRGHKRYGGLQPNHKYVDDAGSDAGCAERLLLRNNFRKVLL
jgi:hypothetical protein